MSLFGFIINELVLHYWLEDSADDSTTPLSEEWPGHEMKSVIQGLLVDRIGKHVGIT